MFSRIEQGSLDRSRPKKAYHIQHAVKIVEFFYRLRWFQTFRIDELLELEFEAMSLIQAELANTEIVHGLEKRKKVDEKLTKEEKETLEKAQERLSVHNHNWWANTHDYYQLLFRKPKGCYIQQLDLFRNEHLTFTEERTQSACKALGVCCAYDCGCCYRERLSQKTWRADALREGMRLLFAKKRAGCHLRRER